MKQTRLVPFNIEKAKQGAKVVTRDGRNVRIGFFNLKGNNSYPFVGAVEIDGQERVFFFTTEGKYSMLDNESSLDLFIEEEEKEKPRREYSGTDSIYVPKDDEGIREELIDAINGLWDNDALPMPLTLKRQTAWITWLQKQGREKSADNKPKFQEGDWVVFNPECNAHQIIRVVENASSHTYGYVTVDDYCFNDTAEGMRLWNINDAKDGDVLVCIGGKYGQEIGIVKKYVGKYGGCDKCFETYCFVDWEGIFRLGEYMGSKEIYPATKEQRDFLFQKMKEEGYEWDEENKELKKVADDSSAKVKEVKKEIKTRRMTNQELADWLRDCTEEHREWKYTSGDIAYSHYCYTESEAFKPVKTILIRRNHGSWKEPLVEL